MLWSRYARIGGMMKKIFIVLMFIFCGLSNFSQAKETKTTLYDEKNFELDFNMKLMMGLTKAENDSKYQKLVNYIDENGNRTFITKGDNNKSEDSQEVDPNDIRGIVHHWIPKIGLPMLMLKAKNDVPEGVVDEQK